MLTKQKVQAAIEAELAVTPHLNATQVIGGLSVGLTHLRKLFLTRIHEDVEQHVGTDSIIAPVSINAELRQAEKAEVEIEIYSSIVVADEVARGGYVRQSEAWLRDQLFELRLRDEYRPLAEERVEYYRSRTAEERRLKFLTILQRAVPESSRTPLVLFRLFPRAVRIVAAVSFGDPLRAQELRDEQCAFLPAVNDCFECHGRVLENDDTCRVCGNPVWKFSWLEAD